MEPATGAVCQSVRAGGDHYLGTHREANLRFFPEQNIPGLTGLRGVAALWVVFFHMSYNTPIPVIRLGYMGVDVFFILSGFVLSHVYARRITGYQSFLRFLQARIARIYPLHFVTLCALGLIVLSAPEYFMRYPLAHERWGISSFLASAFLVQNWAHWLPTCWNTPAWSLSAEVFAYLTFPIFLGFTQRWRGVATPLILAFGSLGFFYVAMALTANGNVNVTGTPGMLRMVCEFACGCLLYRAIWNGLPTLPSAATLIAGALLLVAFSSERADFLALPAFGLIVLLTAQGRGLIASCLSFAPIVFLGEISYSIYLVHWILLQLSNRALSGTTLNGSEKIIWVVGFIGIVLLVALCTFQLIEQPARRWGRRLSLVQPQPKATIT